MLACRCGSCLFLFVLVAVVAAFAATTAGSVANVIAML